MGDNRSCSCLFQSHHYIALEHRSRISTTPTDTRNGEQQFFLARRIPSCLWREASKSPIRRAYGSRLILRVPQEADPFSIFTLHNYVASERYRYPVVGITISSKKTDEDRDAKKEREENIYTLYHVYK